MHIYTYICRIHTDAIIKMGEDFFKKYTFHFIWKICVWEGVGDRTELQHIDPHSYGHQHCVFLVLQGCSTGGLGALSAGCGLSLPHLVTNWSPKLTEFLSSPSYIIVQSPTQYLWNGMFVHHQAEITVMQFIGHSLPVHPSMTVPWHFTLSHIVSQAHLCDFFP